MMLSVLGIYSFLHAKKQILLPLYYSSKEERIASGRTAMMASTRERERKSQCGERGRQRDFGAGWT